MDASPMTYQMLLVFQFPSRKYQKYINTGRKLKVFFQKAVNTELNMLCVYSFLFAVKSFLENQMKNKK